MNCTGFINWILNWNRDIIKVKKTTLMKGVLLCQTFSAHIWEIFYGIYERFIKKCSNSVNFWVRKMSFFLSRSELHQKLIGNVIIELRRQNAYSAVKTSVGMCWPTLPHIPMFTDILSSRFVIIWYFPRSIFWIIWLER